MDPDFRAFLALAPLYDVSFELNPATGLTSIYVRSRENPAQQIKVTNDEAKQLLAGRCSFTGKLD